MSRRCPIHQLNFNADNTLIVHQLANPEIVRYIQRRFLLKPSTVERARFPGTCVCMINYTDCLTLLMQDIVSRVSTLSFFDIGDVLVFARAGRSTAEGAFATCHCLSLPASEP